MQYDIYTHEGSPAGLSDKPYIRSMTPAFHIFRDRKSRYYPQKENICSVWRII